MKFLSIIVGSSKELDVILQYNVYGDDGDYGVVYESYIVLRDGIKLFNIDEMNCDMLCEVFSFFDLFEFFIG